MPGVIIHLLTGSVLYLIGRIIFRTYINGPLKFRKNVFLAIACLIFSILPDFFLGIYYLTHLEPEKILMPYQTFTHAVLTPIAIVILLLAVAFDKRRRPLWLMGASALFLHIILDLFIQESNYLL
jgi:hypothetical protein